MDAPEFDADGYPTEATKQAIAEWEGSINALLDFVAAAWHWPDFGVSHDLLPSEAQLVCARPRERFLRLATGGWSGNESLIAALERHWVARMTWRLSAAGGLHIYRYLAYDTKAGPRPMLALPEQEA